MAEYIIGTGWWCDGSGKHPRDGKRIQETCDFTRKKDFFQVWYEFVNKYTDPEKIVIVDSNSPVRPELPDDNRIEFLSLKENFGHAYTANRMGVRSGWSRSILGGAFYCFLNDVDYFIYIEQDCLVHGYQWIEKCLNNMGKGRIMFGSGEGTPQKIQQSLVIVQKSFIPVFIEMLIKGFERSRKILEKYSPEGQRKGFFGKKTVSIKDHTPESRWDRAFSKDVDYIPFGYGRARPIDFSGEHFYGQHWTRDELEKLFEMEGLDTFKEKLIKEY
jgi:hypothetical protein